MLRNLLRRTAIPTLALAMVIAGCDSLGEQRMLGPSDIAQSDGTTTTTVKYKVLKGITSESGKRDERVIQPAAGGDLGVAGNALIVPAGAVDKPTLFVFKLASADSLGFTPVKVKLEAYQQDSKGKYTVSVGHLGFLKPLRLKMTYEWSTDLVLDPSQLRVLWLKADGTDEVYTTELDSNKKTVSTWLQHFSEYGVGWPN